MVITYKVQLETEVKEVFPMGFSMWEVSIKVNSKVLESKTVWSQEEANTQEYYLKKEWHKKIKSFNELSQEIM